MRDLFKACHITSMKTLDGSDAPGTFEAIVSVFGNLDADGEIVAAGAFTKTLAKGPKPIVYSHDWMSVPIGQTLEAKETVEGLYVKGRLFVGPDEDHARAREVYAAMRAGALSEFSFGGKVVKETRTVADDGDVTYTLDEIDLVEYGPCLKGANPATRLVAVKSLLGDGIVNQAEARAALGLKNDEPEPEPDADAEAETPDDDDQPDEELENKPADADLTPDWSQTLAAVRAGVLSTAEARERLGLPALEADTTAEPDEPDPDAPGSAEVAELLL